MKNNILLTIPLISLAITGCSTAYTITSTPSNANIFVNTIPRGKTPTMIRYKNSFGRDVDLSIMKDGYETMNVSLTSEGGVRNFNLNKINIDAEKKDPDSFKRTSIPIFEIINLQNNLDYNKSWNIIFSIVSKNFDVAMMDKNSGYIRSHWNYKSTGIVRDDYRTRVTIKFNLDKTNLELKSEANFKYNNNWIQGSDINSLETIKTDIKAMIE